MKKKILFTVISALIASSSIAASKVTLQERDIPTTAGVSAEFAEYQSTHVIPPALQAPETTEQWLEFQAAFDAPTNEQGIAIAEKFDVAYEKKIYAGVETFFLTPKEVAPEYEDKWLIHIHGGAFVFGGEESVLREAAWVASQLGAKVISVDYRRPPLDPFPAAIDDAVAVYKKLIESQSPQATAIFGTSAGGNITLTTTLKLKEEGIPLPGALFAGTPATDLKETSESWLTLAGLDPLGQRAGGIQGTFDVYADGEPLDNPLLSPVYADIEDDFPPTMFVSGTRDLLLSDTVRMHRVLRAAGVDTDLHIYDGQAHADYLGGAFADFPESHENIREMKAFFDKHIN